MTATMPVSMSELNTQCDGATQATAWTAELSRHAKWLRTVLIARLDDRDAVDDVLQEVSLAAVQEESRRKTPNNIGAWLYRVALRQVSLHRRKAGRERSRLTRYADAAGVTDNTTAKDDPLGWLLADERRDMIREALKHLPHRDREILLLKYTENWNYHDMADHLDISHSAVEARLHRARRRLRDELNRMKFDETDR